LQRYNIANITVEINDIANDSLIVEQQNDIKPRVVKYSDIILAETESDAQKAFSEKTNKDQKRNVKRKLNANEAFYNMRRAPEIAQEVKKARLEEESRRQLQLENSSENYKDRNILQIRVPTNQLAFIRESKYIILNNPL
jgi:hypothetical protein